MIRGATQFQKIFRGWISRSSSQPPPSSSFSTSSNSLLLSFDKPQEEEEEEDQLREVFRTFDKNENGDISFDEFRGLMEELSPDLDQSHTIDLFHSCIEASKHFWEVGGEDNQPHISSHIMVEEEKKKKKKGEEEEDEIHIEAFITCMKSMGVKEGGRWKILSSKKKDLFQLLKNNNSSS